MRPQSPMIAIYAPMFLMLVTAGALAFAFWGLATFLGRHKKPSAEKNAPFECGSESSGGRIKLSVKFYLTAILFVVFDIEAVFVYPWALHFRDLGWFGLVEMVGFLSVIVVALIYVWRKGALEWET
jgi:NADH-quinone oxidoreductase subunit A